MGQQESLNRGAIFPEPIKDEPNRLSVRFEAGRHPETHPHQLSVREYTMPNPHWSDEPPAVDYRVTFEFSADGGAQSYQVDMNAEGRAEAGFAAHPTYDFSDVPLADVVIKAAQQVVKDHEETVEEHASSMARNRRTIRRGGMVMVAGAATALAGVYINNSDRVTEFVQDASVYGVWVGIVALFAGFRPMPGAAFDMSQADVQTTRANRAISNMTSFLQRAAYDGANIKFVQPGTNNT